MGNSLSSPGAPSTWPPVGETCATPTITSSGLEYGATSVSNTNFTTSLEHMFFQGYLSDFKTSTDGRFVAVSSSWLDTMYLYQRFPDTNNMSLVWSRQIERTSEGGMFGSVFDFDHENSRLAIGWGRMGAYTKGRIEVWDLSTLTRIGLPVEGSTDEQIASGANDMAIALSQNRMCANNWQHGYHVACFEHITGCADSSSVCWTPMDTLVNVESSEFGRHVAMSSDTRTLLISGNKLWHYELNGANQYEFVEEIRMQGGWELDPSTPTGFQSADFMDERFSLSVDGTHLGVWYNTWYYQLDEGALPWTPTPTTETCGASRIRAGSVEFFKFDASTRRYAFRNRFLGGVSYGQVGYTVRFSAAGDYVYISNLRNQATSSNPNPGRSNVSTNLYGSVWHAKWSSPPTSMSDLAVYSYPGLEMLCQPMEVERGSTGRSPAIFPSGRSSTPSVMLAYENWRNREHSNGQSLSETRFIEADCLSEVASACAASQTLDATSRMHALRTSQLVNDTWKMASPLSGRAYTTLFPLQGSPTAFRLADVLGASFRVDATLGADSKFPLLVVVLGDEGPYSASATVSDIVADLNTMGAHQYRTYGGSSCHTERASGAASFCIDGLCSAGDGRSLHALVDLNDCDGGGSGDTSKTVRAILAMTDENPSGTDYDVTFDAVHADCLFATTFESTQLPTVPTSASTVQGDPHILLAHGGHADFRGEAGRYFNFVSHRSASLNVKLDASIFWIGKAVVDGTFITEAHLATPLMNVSYFADELNDNLYSWRMVRGTCAGADFVLGPKGSTNCTDTSVVNDYSSSLWTTPDWTIRVRPNRVYGRIGGVTRRIDLEIHKRRGDAENGFAHGVVGQSFDGDERARSGKTDLYPTSGVHTTIAQAEGAIEGKYTDYRVDGPYSTNFSFSRYGRVASRVGRANWIA